MNQESMMEVHELSSESSSSDDSTGSTDDESYPQGGELTSISPPTSPPPVTSTSAATKSPSKQVGNPVYVQAPVSKASIIVPAGKSSDVTTTTSAEVRVTPKTSILVRPANVTQAQLANGSIGIQRGIISANSPQAVRYVTPGSVTSKAMIKASPGVWTSALKKTTGNPVQKVIFPSMAGQPGQIITSSGTVGSPPLSLVINQGSGKQLGKSYVVSPSQSGKSVNIIPRSVYVNSDGQKKIVGTGVVQQKDGRIITPTGYRPVNMVNQAGGKMVATSSIGASCFTVGTQKLALITREGEKRIVIAKPGTQFSQVRPQAVHLATEAQTTAPSYVLTTGTVATSLSHTVTVTASATSTTSTPTVTTNVSTSLPSAVSTDGVGEGHVPPDAKLNGYEIPEKSNSNSPSEDSTPSKVGDAKSVDSESSDSQSTNTNTPANGAKSSETTSTPDQAEGEPLEKKSAVRKATILSFPKPKLKTSLLNGGTEPRKSSNYIEMSSLMGKPINPPINSERRKRKDNHKPAAIFETPQKQLQNQELGSFIKPIPGAEDLKALSVIKWDGMGLGMLPGSTVRFTKNELGMLEVHEPLLLSKMELDEINGEKIVKPRDPTEIYCCSVCSCYGLLSEFNTEFFCSNTCYDTLMSMVDRISTKITEEPLLVHKIDEKTNRKRVDKDDSSDAPPVKQKKVEDSVADSEENTQDSGPKKIKMKANQKSDALKPMIKLKSMDLLTAPSSPSGRQLRTRDPLGKKPASRYIVGQDLEEVVDEDDEKIKDENVDPFPWAEYLQVTQSSPAWIKLFGDQDLTSKNPFKIGFKLEAIDPERQGLFCAATVADVQGHRLKIHFDGYPNKYDFWTNMDSPNIFECGFAERHNIPLQPPYGMKRSSFNWSTYQTARKVRPCHLSWFKGRTCSTTNMFRPGMKLEAVDKKNTQLTCVATCVGVIEDRIQVHFDSWSDVYDYWVKTDSPYIHPVGWCKARRRELTPPNYYTSAVFSWDSYLKETKSEAAPVEAFTLRPSKDWKRNTKVEAIDKRAPHLLRVATIKDVLPYQIRITFDGFPDHFGYWVDDDCPDIHPVGWGLKTGHPVSAPPEPYQIQQTTCPTPGCVGDGNWLGLHTDSHATAEECPYSNEHLSAESPLQQRLEDSKLSNKKKLPVLGNDDDDESDEDPESNWKFLDAAYDRVSSKGRLAADGTFVQAAKKVRIPYVLPLGQTFRGARPAVSTMAQTPNTIKGEEPVDNADKRPIGRRLERRASDKSLEAGNSSQEKKFERKASFKGLRRSLPAKSVTGVQAGSPAKGRTSDVGTSLLPRKTGKTETADQDFAQRMRSKIATELSLNKNADILTWDYEQCGQKLKDLPPKCQAVLKKYKLNGERFLMLTNLLQTRLFESLTPSESKSLHNAVAALHTEATVGLDKWKPVKADSKYGSRP